MNAIRSLACLLLVLPLLSACSNDTVGAAEPSFEPVGVADEAAPPDSGQVPARNCDRSKLYGRKAMDDVQPDCRAPGRNA